MFYWGGDWSDGTTKCYGDTTGHPVGGQYDLMVSTPGGGAWLPWPSTLNFDASPYEYVQLDLKPTKSNTTWFVQFVAIGDVAIPATATLPSDAHGTYGPAPVVGQWATYRIPLKNLNVGPGTPNVHFKELYVGNKVNTGADSWYLNNMKFDSIGTVGVDHPVSPVASVNHLMIATATNRSINFTTKSAGTINVFDMLGNQLAALHVGNSRIAASWIAMATGAYLVRFQGSGASGAIETQRVLVR